MDMNTFENCLFTHLKNNDKECLNDIDVYSKLIKDYFVEEKNPKYIMEFVSKLNNNLLEVDTENYELYEQCLIHPLFVNVLEEFKNSTILIEACKNGNKNLLNWLLTMDINARVQNEFGVTALMNACKNNELLFVVDYLLENGAKSVDLLDNNGENALFYAVPNIDCFRALMKTDIDTTVLNKDNDSIFSYCCRNKIYEPIKTLVSVKSVDVNYYVNYYNNDGKNAIMYLLEEGRSKEIGYLIDIENINFYFENERGETPLSLFIKKYYEYYQKADNEALSPYYDTLKLLIDNNINFNQSIDEEGNTPLMFFMMIEDWCTVAYFLLNCKNLDLSFENKNGVSANKLCLGIKESSYTSYSGIILDDLRLLFLDHPTFEYKDSADNNVYDYFLLKDPFKTAVQVLKHNGDYVKGTNINQENPLIIATKIGCRDIIKSIINAPGCNINQQDNEGNTALHHAVKLNDYYLANLLAYYHADINIKNNEGLSPINIANNSNDTNMSKFLIKPLLPYEVSKLEKKKGKSSLFKKSKKGDFMPLNEELRNKYIEYYENIMEFTFEPTYKTTKFAEFSSKLHQKAFNTFFHAKRNETICVNNTGENCSYLFNTVFLERQVIYWTNF